MSIMRKRTIAIIAAALCIVILGFSLAAVLEYVSIIEFEDVDNIKYYAKKDGDTYKLYAKNSKEPLALDEKYEKYYVTAAGTLVLLDAETGRVKEKILVDNVEREDLIDQTAGNRVLVYPYLLTAEMLSLEVYNADGAYCFEKLNDKGEPDINGSFVIKGSSLTNYDRVLFSSLCRNAGYALATRKVDPIRRDENGNICTHKDGGCSCKKDFNEYGLVEGERTRCVYDEDGQPVIDEATGERVTETYYHEPTYFILTAKDEKGNTIKHKVILGDALVTGEGYYALYVDISGDTEVVRERLYVLDNSTGETMNAPIEDYVTPAMGYPMTQNKYHDVDDFTISHRQKDNYAPGADLTGLYRDVISFSFVDLSEREGSMAIRHPYQFKLGLAGYTASETAISTCLYSMYAPDMVRTVKFAPEMDDLVEYGFYVEALNADGTPVYVEQDGKQVKKYETFADARITYKYEVTGDDGKVTTHIYQTILISKKDYEETKTYYTHTLELRVPVDKNGDPDIDAGIASGDSDEVKEEKISAWMKENTFAYNYIAEVRGHTLDFVDWDAEEWVTPSVVNDDILFLTDLKLTGYASGVQNYFAEFKVNVPESDKNTLVADNLFVNASYKKGDGETVQRPTTFSNLEIKDRGGYYWNVTYSQIEVYSKNEKGEKVYDREIPDGLVYFGYNALGRQVLCKHTAIEGVDGNGDLYYVWVYKDYVTITKTADPNYTESDVVVSYTRYDTSLFKEYYKTVLYMAIAGSYKVSAEEEAALTVDTNLMASLDVTFKDSEAAGGTEITKTIRFYKIPDSARKIYITVSVDAGEESGGFYVYKNKVEKLFTDAEKFFANQPFDPAAKK